VTHVRASGHTPRLLARQAGRASGGDPATEMVVGDLAEGGGLQEALCDVDAIIHCATAPQDAQRVDVGGTRRLLGRAARTTRLIYPSIVGVERSAYPYYQAKRAAEALIEQGPLPWAILRATQFHDLI